MALASTRWASVLGQGVSYVWRLTVILNFEPTFKSLDISLRLRFLASLSKLEAVVSHLEQVQGHLGGRVPITSTLPGPARLWALPAGPPVASGLPTSETALR